MHLFRITVLLLRAASESAGVSWVLSSTEAGAGGGQPRPLSSAGFPASAGAVNSLQVSCRATAAPQSYRPATSRIRLTLSAHPLPLPPPAGSLQSITTKLQLLHSMMSTPPPGSPEAESAPKYTPFERLKLLREVTEDARVFRLGGEDKIRVATSTCETVSLRSVLRHCLQLANRPRAVDRDPHFAPSDPLLPPPHFPPFPSPTAPPSPSSTSRLPFLLHLRIHHRPSSAIRLPSLSARGSGIHRSYARSSGHGQGTLGYDSWRWRE